ncbi:MAG TPA: ATP-grasp domain-containing protein [Rhizomicrobium sp.]
MRILLLAAGFAAQYRVLRCAAALHAEVCVLGSGAARSLALSRYCRQFRPFSFDAAEPVEAARRLDAEAHRWRADIVLPGDFATTKFLARVQPHLRTAAFPLPDADSVDSLGGKDRFMQACREFDIPHPEGIVVSDRAALMSALASGQITLPAIVKPLALAGGMGVARIDSGNVFEVAAQIDYAPILVQRFVEGIDRCITIFCREGQVRKQAIYEHPNGVFRFVEDAELARLAARLASVLNLTGVINFDARIDRDGRVWMIECNPRFYFNMDVAMVAGLNFADWRADIASVREREVRIPNALLRGLLRMRRPSAVDLRMLWHWLNDPLMFALVATGYQQRWQFPFFEKVATSHKCAV